MTPLQRNSGGECGSTASRRSASSLRAFVRHTCAQPKHALQAVQLVEDRSLGALGGDPVRLERDRQAAQVADVLADRELAVDVVARQVLGLEVVVLLDERLGPLTELGAVVVGPPVDHVAVAVVLGALVVEAVADLVADHRADTP